MNELKTNLIPYAAGRCRSAHGRCGAIPMAWRAMETLGLRQVNLALKPAFAENGADYLAAVRHHAWTVSAATIGFFHEDYTSLESIRATGGIVPDEHWRAAAGWCCARSN